MWSPGTSKATSANRWQSKLWISEQLCSTEIMVSLSTHFCIQHPLKEVFQISPTAWGAPELSVQARSGQQKTEAIPFYFKIWPPFYSAAGVELSSIKISEFWSHHLSPSPHKKVKADTVWDWVCMGKQDTQYPPEDKGLHLVLHLHCKASHLKSERSYFFISHTAKLLQCFIINCIFQVCGVSVKHWSTTWCAQAEL